MTPLLAGALAIAALLAMLWLAWPIVEWIREGRAKPKPQHSADDLRAIRHLRERVEHRRKRDEERGR